MEQEGDVYQDLRAHLDNMPVGFPRTGSGAEIRFLKRLFTSDEARIALALSALPEPLERIYRRVKDTGISIEDLGRMLDGMVDKGAILGVHMLANDPLKKRYSKAPFAIGMYEMQVDRLTKELQQDALEYLEGGFAQAFHTTKTSQMRTIPINRTVTPDRRVSPFDDVRELVRSSKGPFAVLNCICRQGMELLDQPCRQTDIRRTCLTLESMARATLHSGVGRAVSRDEMLGLLDRANQVGMVLQPANTRRPLFICCCCGCCCGVLRSAKKFPRPAEYFHTNYYAEVDPELCAGCETCIDRCQMEALSMKDDISSVDLGRCIGCGLCVSTCPNDAMSLKKKEQETVPPKDHPSLYRKMMMERFGILGTLRMMGKAALGMKI